MLTTGKEHSALLKLLRLAREEHAALREDLADLAIARQAAERSLSHADVTASARRRRVMAILATYETAEQAAREKLAAASARAGRLEALVAHLPQKAASAA
ncbi:hypothetical protein [Hyphococcus sp.]|uniref:hypothetical protein n=1 Tax=Hyphococcus sp. TaxID=2038636 RepID=UPI0035C6C5F7